MQNYTAIEKHVEKLANVSSCTLTYLEFLKSCMNHQSPKTIGISMDWKAIAASEHGFALEVRSENDANGAIILNGEGQLAALWNLAFKPPGAEEEFNGAIYRYEPQKSAASLPLTRTRLDNPLWNRAMSLLLLGLAAVLWLLF
jgi:hypothetical protein